MKAYNAPQIKTIMFRDEAISAAAASMEALNQWETDNNKKLTTTAVDFKDAVKLIF